MTTTEGADTTRDHFYYHGHTVVEQVRRGHGVVLWRHWHLFDTVEDAQQYYFNTDGAVTMGGER